MNDIDKILKNTKLTYEFFEGTGTYILKLKDCLTYFFNFRDSFTNTEEAFLEFLKTTNIKKIERKLIRMN